MTTKRKLITAVASLGILVILAGVALGVALAALTGNVTSGFTINYTAYNVSAAISGSWGYTEDFMKTMTSNGGNKILFTGSETNGTAAQKSFDPLGNIELSATNPSVTFKYRFLNFDSSKALPISFTLDGDMENLDVNYSVKTFDGSSTTTTPSGSMTDLPTTINNISVPYSGFSSYDEMYQEAMDMLDADESTIAMLKILFTQGDEALVAALKAAFNPQSDEEYKMIMWLYAPAASVNTYRIFLETGSDEQAVGYLESIVQKDFFPEPKDVASTTALIGDLSSTAILQESAKNGRYDLVFNSSLMFMDCYFASRGYHNSGEAEELTDDWKYAYQVMKYNLLDILYTKGYEAAINLAQELYERNYQYFIDPSDEMININDEAYFMNNFNALKEALSEYVGNDSLSTIEQRRAACMADAQDLIMEDMEISKQYKGYISLAQDKLVDFIAEYDIVSYTEITVTISINNDTDEAYLNSGNFEFVLGNI